MNAFLITFKPATESADRGMPLRELQDIIERRHRGELPVENWRFFSRKDVFLGTRVFLLLQGKGGPAIIGYGNVAGPPRLVNGTRILQVQFESIVDPSVEVLADKHDLLRIEGGKPFWSIQASGRRLSSPVADQLERLVVGKPGKSVAVLRSQLPVKPGGRVFGDIPGYPKGTMFESRAALSKAGLHRPTMAGISGTSADGADSIVLSGGYDDDQDEGTVVLYTGHGGRHPNTGEQVADQQFSGGNAALAKNKVLGLPVRVIRGAQLDSSYAPSNGYRYDGLYFVESYEVVPGKAGFKVWRFRLVEQAEDIAPPVKPGVYAPPPPVRRPSTTSRIVRDTIKSRRVKEWYDYTCQVCGIALRTPAGTYAEGAHIKGLGGTHEGPDVESNILCLCPNHHVLFDNYAISITDDFRILGIPGNPRLHRKHDISLDCIRYHRHTYDVLANIGTAPAAT